MNKKQRFSSAEKIILAIKNKTPLFLIDAMYNTQDCQDGGYFKENITRIFHFYDDEWKIVDIRSCENEDDVWTQIVFSSSHILEGQDLSYDWSISDDHIFSLKDDHYQIDNRYVFPFEIEAKIQDLKSVSNAKDIAMLFDDMPF